MKAGLRLGDWAARGKLGCTTVMLRWSSNRGLIVSRVGVGVVVMVVVMVVEVKGG